MLRRDLIASYGAELVVPVIPVQFVEVLLDKSDEAVDVRSVV